MKKLSLFLLVLFIPLVFGFGAMSIMGSSDVMVEDETSYADYRWSGVDGQSWFGGDNLGSDLFDAGAGVFTTGTYAWTVYGSNTIANVGNALVITWVDDAGGAHLEWSDAEDLSADLAVGALYKVKFDASINTGSATIHIYNQAGSSIDSITVSLSALQTFTIYFVATHTTGDYMRMLGMGSGEEITIDNITIQAATSPADYADSGAFVKVCSSGGTDAANCATGYIGAAGSGETLGSELIINPSFDVNTTGWESAQAILASVAGGVSNNSLRITEDGGIVPQAFDTIEVTINKNYRISVWVKEGTESTYSVVLSNWGTYTRPGASNQEATAVWTYLEFYGVPGNALPLIYLVQNTTASSVTTFFFDEASWKEITEPNPNSVMIYKEPHLATEGWLTIGASFDPNDINTFIIYQ